jgi:HEAT repeat protein
MRNRLYAVLVGLLLAALGWSILQAVRQPREPVYDGKPLGYWMAYYFVPAQSPSPPVVASNFVRQVREDSSAVPFLVRALERDRWAGATFYRKWLWPNLPPPIRSRMPPPADKALAQMRAAALLREMGPIAAPSIPALIRTLKQDEQPFVRNYAAWALVSLGNGDKTAIAALTEALKDTDRFVRGSATNALLKADPEAAVRAGVKAPPWASSGQADKSFITALASALTNQEKSLRVYATNALRRTAPGVATKAGVKPPLQ